MPYSLQHVVDQHAEETAILWARRVRLAGEPHVSLDALARLDGQLVAHLEGLRLAGAAGRDACWREFEDWSHPGEAFAVAALALETESEPDWRRALDAAEENPSLVKPLASALAWQPLERVKDNIDALLAAPRPAEQEIGARAAALHRHDAAGQLWKLLDGRGPPAAISRVCRAAAEEGRLEQAPFLADLMRHAHADVAFAATKAAAWLGDAGALRGLVDGARVAGDARAIEIVAARLPIDEAGAWLRSNFDGGGHRERRGAILASGILGDPALVPWLIECMHDLRLARLAGDALTAMTGVHLGIERLERPWPAAFAAGPNDDPADDDVSLDADENRLWPDVERVAQWWRGHEECYLVGVRHLAGRPLDSAWLRHVLRHGTQPQRASAARELAWRSPGEPMFDVRAPGWRQFGALEAGF